MPGAVVVVLALAIPVPAHAQAPVAANDEAPTAEVPDAPSVSALRRRLERLSDEVGEATRVGIAYQLDTAARIDRRFPVQSAEWRLRAARFLTSAEGGGEPYREARGEIVPRGYRSGFVEDLQGYAIYLPRDYDPSRRHPLMVVLHGGSSNGNLFLGVVLGRNLPWTDYKKHLWDTFTPRWFPEDWIVVAPDGFGQVMWRWMGERDVLDVIDDVRRHYAVDDDRIVLGGLSNGGVGAYALGSRHAHRFAQVQAMAGAPSWVQYAGGMPRLRAERRALLPWSGLHLAENTTNTDFRWFHGDADTGPMRPAYVREYEAEIARLGLPNQGTWYEAGHDILYRVHRHGRIYTALGDARRRHRPREVRVVTGDYQAATQHWVTVTRLADPPRLGRVVARVSDPDGHAVEVTTSEVRALRLDLGSSPLAATGSFRIAVDGATAFEGAREALGDRIHLVRDPDGGWRTGYPHRPDDGLEKRPGLSGPISDAYTTPLVHVYGTQRPEATDALRAAAERGSRGWPLWLWRYRQRVAADSELTPEDVAQSHLVLYGTPGSNRILAGFRDRLPIRVAEDGVHVGGELVASGPDVGARFIYPNPAALDAGRDRYLVVQAGTTPDAVEGGHRLPDFVPDWIVYDGRTTRSRSRLLTGRNRAVRMGWFDQRWRLAPSSTPTPTKTPTPGGGEQGATGPSPPPVLPGTPSDPPRPRRFDVPYRDPAGPAARSLARRVATFPNFRGAVPRGRWRVRPADVWRVPRERACLADLRARGVPARRAPDELGIDPGVPTPVVLEGTAGPLVLRNLHPDRPMVVACALAARLPGLARVLAEHGVMAIDVVSAHRPRPRTSFHALGLALDVWGFSVATPGGGRRELLVRDHFEETPDRTTCDGAPADTWAGAILDRITCALFDSGLLSTVLTPNYNEGHRDHLHLDMRPDDPRQFLR